MLILLFFFYYNSKNLVRFTFFVFRITFCSILCTSIPHILFPFYSCLNLYHSRIKFIIKYFLNMIDMCVQYRSGNNPLDYLDFVVTSELWLACNCNIDINVIVVMVESWRRWVFRTDYLITYLRQEFVLSNCFNVLNEN